MSREPVNPGNLKVSRDELAGILSNMDRELQRREQALVEEAGGMVMLAAMRHLMIVFLALLALDAFFFVVLLEVLG